MKKPSAYLIFNPVSGQGDSEQELALIRSILEPELDVEIAYTTAEIDAAQLAQIAIQKRPNLIIASGGDGTVSATAAALINTAIPLGIIARGTANAFATALDIPTTIAAACETILHGNRRQIDTAWCNDRPMILLTGIGFEAETVEKADRGFKDRMGIFAYILAGVQQLQNLENFDVEIETEDKIIKTSAAAVTVANVAPPTSVLAQGPAGVIADDGLLDLTIVAPTNKLSAIAAAYHLFQSASTEHAAERDDTGYLRKKQFKITTNPPQKVVLDGEIIGETPVMIRCLPLSLSVFVPSIPEQSPLEKLEGLPNLVVESK